MTVRDPYTGVERPARPHPARSPLQRWWPAIAIAVVAIVVGYVEWHTAQTPRRPPPGPTATSQSATVPQTASPSAMATPAAPDELARATAALERASDQLSGTSNFLIGIAALQAIVLIGQLYLFGQQRRAGQRKPD